jgi:peptidase C80-like protein
MKLSINSRIYIRGHGSFTKQTVGGLTAESWATILKELGMPRVGIVSVTGCRAGRDLNSTDENPLLDVMNSFASEFHKQLKEITKQRCDVVARTQYVGVLPSGKKQTTPTLTRNTPPLTKATWTSKAPNIKYKFTWASDGAQVRLPVVYRGTGGKLN